MDVGSFGRRGAAVDEAFNSGLMLIPLNFRSIGQIQIAKIAVDNSAILTDKFFVDIDIVDIGGGGFNGMNHAGTGIHAHIRLHSKIPLVVFLGLVHLKNPLFLLILRRTGRSDDGGVNNSAGTVHEIRLFKTCIQLCKDVLEHVLRQCPNTVFLGHAPGFWGNFGQNTGGAQNVETLLRKYKNLYCDISANSGYRALSRDVRYARSFLETFADRVVYGRDMFENIHKELLDSLDLDKDVIEMICGTNAERLTAKCERRIER